MTDNATTAAIIESIKKSIEIAKFLKDTGLSLEDAEKKLKLAELVSLLADAKLELSEVRQLLIDKDMEIQTLEDRLSARKKVKWEFITGLRKAEPGMAHFASIAMIPIKN